MRILIFSGLDLISLIRTNENAPVLNDTRAFEVKLTN